MKLVDPKEFAKAANLNSFGGRSMARLFMTILRFNKINRIYSKLYDKHAEEFLDLVVKELKLKFEVSDEDFSKIPVSGPFITISNHPFGGVEGIILIKIISKIRPDYKVMANFLLQRLQPIQENFLPVNPFESYRDNISSVKGIKYALNHLKEEGCLGIFPAGEVSSYYPEFTGISDRIWKSSIIKFLKKAEVPIIPVYFMGTNSRFFHFLGLIHPMLRTVKLPSELFNKKNKIIRIRIGNPITLNEQNGFSDINRYGRYLRAKVYSLGTTLEVRKFFSPTLKRSKKVEEIINSTSLDKIVGEIEKIKNQYFLFRSKNFSVYSAPSVEIPNIVNEIGRLRELTFREVGEGTNRRIDIDEFDLYFHQLFIWDETDKKIVGAYRVGKGKEILLQYGINGFYIQSLFKIDPAFAPILGESIELGRSFIVKDYQKKPLPLFLLWKGILYFLLKHPEYRYLIGPVSISNRFSKFSKSMIIEFLKTNYYNHEYAKYIKPRKKFVVNTKNVDTEILMESASKDLNKFDKTIKDIEPDNIPMPVLLKKYLKLNGSIIGFNIDPKFNDALDGLIILDLYNIPLETITSLSREINDETILERFFVADFKNARNADQNETDQNF